MAKLARSSETAIGIVFLVMGLEKALRIFFLRLVRFIAQLPGGFDYVELSVA
jgi:hypothetical protein